jgi:putative FmdB family regulatory protein
MPIYDYECRRCGRLYDKLTSDVDKKTSECPDCGGLAKRVFSVTARPRGSEESGLSSNNPKICPICYIIKTCLESGIPVKIAKITKAPRYSDPSNN